MNIFDHIKERRSSKKYESDIEAAMEIFERQKSGIKAIKDTSGFREIVEYWERQKRAAEIRFDTSIQEGKIDNLTRARYLEATKFLNFLKNLLESSK